MAIYSRISTGSWLELFPKLLTSEGVQRNHDNIEVRILRFFCESKDGDGMSRLVTQFVEPTDVQSETELNEVLLTCSNVLPCGWVSDFLSNKVGRELSMLKKETDKRRSVIGLSSKKSHFKEFREGKVNDLSWVSNYLVAVIPQFTEGKWLVRSLVHLQFTGLRIKQYSCHQGKIPLIYVPTIKDCFFIFLEVHCTLVKCSCIRWLVGP
ncbi:hypothetical protein P5673_005257 [Acropora cervicornis]|uniref:Uncharacterized protein n=1 Tax=Acropora cervicornis TaxID=6130 RepID=A0AAD9VE06_ACRCE|nr:hypothetical protein P5673_005257 [Acropora cervicornis]